MTLKSQLNSLIRASSSRLKGLSNSPLAPGVPAGVALGLYFLVTTFEPGLNTSSKPSGGNSEEAPAVSAPTASRLKPFAQLLDTDSPRAQAYATGVATQRFDQNGKLQNSVKAASQLQIGEDLVLLEEPILVFYESGIEEWTLRSNLGRLRHSAENNAQSASDTLELLGAAELNASEQNDSDLRLSAPTLIVEPQREIVSTDQRVELIDTGINQSAQGFDANLQTDTMRFHSAVRGNYAPTTQQ
jgi:LPS export ABC transporter protein LptC